MEHARTMNSWFTNPHIQNNKDLYEKLSDMNDEELMSYYNTVEYAVRRRNAGKK